MEVEIAELQLAHEATEGHAEGGWRPLREHSGIRGHWSRYVHGGEVADPPRVLLHLLDGPGGTLAQVTPGHGPVEQVLQAHEFLVGRRAADRARARALAFGLVGAPLRLIPLARTGEALGLPALDILVPTLREAQVAEAGKESGRPGWPGPASAPRRPGAEVIEGPVERRGGRDGGRARGTSLYVRDPDANLLEFMIYP